MRKFRIGLVAKECDAEKVASDHFLCLRGDEELDSLVRGTISGGGVSSLAIL